MYTSVVDGGECGGRAGRGGGGGGDGNVDTLIVMMAYVSMLLSIASDFAQTLCAATHKMKGHMKGIHTEEIRQSEAENQPKR